MKKWLQMKKIRMFMKHIKKIVYTILPFFFSKNRDIPTIRIIYVRVNKHGTNLNIP